MSVSGEGRSRSGKYSLLGLGGRGGFLGGGVQRVLSWKGSSKMSIMKEKRRRRRRRERREGGSLSRGGEAGTFMETGGGSCVTPHAVDYHGLYVTIATVIVCMVSVHRVLWSR